MEQVWQEKLIDLGRVTLPAIIAVAGTLGAAFLTYWFLSRQARAAKALDFVERRVREFYSPMVGCIKRIGVWTELQSEMAAAADVEWRQICDRAPKPFMDHGKRSEPFKRLIEHGNEQFYTEILPLYDRMVAIFTEHYWLADEKTQRHYGELCRFVDIWHGYKATAIPPEVLLKLKHKGEELYPLCEMLERKLREYTDLVANSRAGQPAASRKSGAR
jgi:hypothetical protein